MKPLRNFLLGAVAFLSFLVILNPNVGRSGTDGQYSPSKDWQHTASRDSNNAITPYVMLMPSNATVVHSVAYEASHIISATPKVLIHIFGYNSGAQQFIQIFDSATLPDDNAVPLATFVVGATSNFSLDVPMTGLPTVNGIVVCNSSTGPTKTIGSANCFFTAVIR